VKADHLSRADRLLSGECGFQERVVCLASASQDFPAAVKPQDIGRTFEGAEHDGEPAVRLKMRGRLVAAAGPVQIDDGVVVENGEGLCGARRDVDPRARRSRRGEKHALLTNEFAMLRLELWKLLAHEIG
jgi:hypothetical protein